MTTEQLANLRLEALKIASQVCGVSTIGNLLDETEKIFYYLMNGKKNDKPTV